MRLLGNTLEHSFFRTFVIYFLGAIGYLSILTDADTLDTRITCPYLTCCLAYSGFQVTAHYIVLL